MKNHKLNNITDIMLIENFGKLEELARDKSFIANELHYNSKTVIEHLIKLLLWGNISKSNINHWITEITGSMYNTYRIKGTNKYPTYKQLKKWYLDDDMEILQRSIDRVVKKLASEEKLKIPNYDKNTLYNCIYNYLDWICQELPITGIVDENKMENKIKEIQKDYNS